jgi:hypothetical protein
MEPRLPTRAEGQNPAILPEHQTIAQASPLYSANPHAAQSSGTTFPGRS